MVVVVVVAVPSGGGSVGVRGGFLWCHFRCLSGVARVLLFLVSLASFCPTVSNESPLVPAFPIRVQQVARSFCPSWLPEKRFWCWTYGAAVLVNCHQQQTLASSLTARSS